MNTDSMTVLLTPENAVRIKHMAEMFEMTVDEMVNRRLSWFLEDVYDGRRIGEIDVTALSFDDVDEAKRIVARVEEHDQSNRVWTFKADSDGRIDARYTFARKEAE